MSPRRFIPKHRACYPGLSAPKSHPRSENSPEDNERLEEGEEKASLSLLLPSLPHAF